ncbi:hypothetical protein VTP01DRAFT_8726 [Rhizomucor pusillus]|uniref:uncharacterized protein n=1 Tax=Rhizomucor pusillus TaxID=4840 RepID=UPI0037437976
MLTNLYKFSPDHCSFMTESQYTHYAAQFSRTRSYLQAITRVGKLGNLGFSIEDARKAVQLSPDMSLGYLQLAHVLLKRGEARETLMVYKKAMKNVTRDDKLYDQLESSKRYVEEQLNNRVSIFLPKLPYEIVDRILSFLY